MQRASQISSVVVAAVLLFTGVIHAAQPYYFVHTISTYRLVSADASGVLGIWLPCVHIILGLDIGLGIAERVALYTSAMVFTAFAFAQLSVLIRGMDIDCGCFGFVARVVSPASVALPVLLTGACVFGAAGQRNDRRIVSDGP